MKTTSAKTKKSGTQLRPEQLSTEKQRSYKAHNANRELPTRTVLEYLRSQLPQQYELAEIVGQAKQVCGDAPHP